MVQLVNDMEKEVFEAAQNACSEMQKCLEVLKHEKHDIAFTLSIGLNNYPIDDCLKEIILTYYKEKYDENAEIFKNL